MTDLQNRIDALEIKAAHQEQQLNDLSEMVSDQWKLIERLGGALSKADARLESLENNNAEPASGPNDEKPPHY
ncbi:MAG: SlyX family protein [Kordiimonadaceae bacterium]|jgi:SlyX protein|nr:SlyX family protein [Kordiimonadaceae bacterium]MBT6035019.1 SlyX family protein [Kordiimonadaceae bacterium]MBT6328237.1 SlyX family protein [Kordiimonadaceae bacterium]MBT7582692.1 SlyX family protein [Kordiimonadaceae bacterium]